MRRAMITWTIGFVVLIAAFFATIAILNATLFSAHGFVKGYLDALNRHDATTARSLPGVDAAGGAATNLLTDSSLSAISRIHLATDSSDSKGVHDVTYGFTLGKQHQESTFEVRQTAPFLGLFNRWSFEKSPLATVSVTVLHDRRFRVNGTDVTTKTAVGTASSYVVFAPGLYTFDHHSTYLTASKVGVPVNEPGSVTPVQVDVEANSAFVKEVRSQLTKYLDKCATQHVLLPTACPFGKTFENRVVSTPSWAMVKTPAVAIVPDRGTGKWLVSASIGEAHLKVKVQSLYDGSVTTFDKDVDFQTSYDITIATDDHLTITSLYE